MHETNDWWKRAQQNAENNQAENFTLPPDMAYKEFIEKILEKPKTLVENLIDHKSRLIFGGGSKTYKTWAMLDLAQSIVCGADWWGFKTAVSPAIYINFELPDYYLQSRMRAIKQAKELDYGPLWIWHLRGYPIGLNAFCDALAARISERSAEIVFVDPFYKLLGPDGDERSSRDINKIMLAFDAITRETGASVVFATHFLKGNQSGKESMDRISGGGSINRDPDNLITLTKHEAEASFSVEFTNRNHAPTDPFVVSWEYPLLVRNSDLDPDDIKRPVGEKRSEQRSSYDADQMLAVVRDNDDQLTKQQLYDKMTEDFAWSLSACRRKLKELFDQKAIFISKTTGFVNVAVRSGPHPF
jgi:RecA-family ATPase